MTNTKWYYMVGTERRGPVDTGTLELLATSGVLQRDSMVWAEGTANWRPAGEVVRVFTKVSVAPPTMPAAVPPPFPQAATGSTRLTRGRTALVFEDAPKPKTALPRLPSQYDSNPPPLPVLRAEPQPPPLPEMPAQDEPPPLPEEESGAADDSGRENTVLPLPDRYLEILLISAVLSVLGTYWPIAGAFALAADFIAWLLFGVFVYRAARLLPTGSLLLPPIATAALCAIPVINVLGLFVAARDLYSATQRALFNQQRQVDLSIGLTLLMCAGVASAFGVAFIQGFLQGAGYLQVDLPLLPIVVDAFSKALLALWVLQQTRAACVLVGVPALECIYRPTQLKAVGVYGVAAAGAVLMVCTHYGVIGGTQFERLLGDLPTAPMVVATKLDPFMKEELATRLQSNFRRSSSEFAGRLAEMVENALPSGKRGLLAVLVWPDADEAMAVFKPDSLDKARLGAWLQNNGFKESKEDGVALWTRPSPTSGGADSLIIAVHHGRLYAGSGKQSGRIVELATGKLAMEQRLKANPDITAFLSRVSETAGLVAILGERVYPAGFVDAIGGKPRVFGVDASASPEFYQVRLIVTFADAEAAELKRTVVKEFFKASFKGDPVLGDPKTIEAVVRGDSVLVSIDFPKKTTQR